MCRPFSFYRLQVRYRREHPSARQPPYFPVLEDLMRDGSDGAALLAVVHYYCPEQMKLDGESCAPGSGPEPCSAPRTRVQTCEQPGSSRPSPDPSWDSSM